MIGALRGELIELEFGEHAVEALLDVNGVGYRVSVGARHAAELGPIGSLVAFSIHTHVREGSIALYGFANAEERRTFEVLLATHGVGPALALAILSVHAPAALVRAVSAGDVAALALVPGVGKKTAQRLVLELAQRLETVDVGPPSSGQPKDAEAEVREALSALGYGQDEIRHALEALPEAGSVETLLREALAELAPRR